MTPIRIRTLGGLSVERDGREVADLPAQPVRCALLLYLALEGSASRDELTGLLWPDRDEERARHSLSQTLYELRRVLGDEWLDARTERVAVREGEVIVDALAFASAVEEGRNEEALESFVGPFLQATHAGGTHGFEAWVDRWRSRLDRLHARACARAARAREESGDLEGALAIARRWTEIDPLDDEAQHGLIRLLSATGQRAGALRQFDRYEELLARELEVEPLEQTRALVARIRDGELASTEAGSEEPAPPPPSPGSADPSPERQRPSGTTTWRPGGRGSVLATAGLLLIGLVGALVLRGANAADPSPEPGGEGAGPPTRLGGIAVLPFVNMSPDPDQDYFSDGMTEDLITHLSRIDGLRVISRTSVMRHKSQDTPVAEIAREFDVAYVLQGSVRRDAGRVRITAQLIDPDADDHLWAETFDRELTDIFRIQSEISERVAEALQQHLPRGDLDRIAGGGTTRLAAYDLLLKGREYLHRPGEADVRKYPPAMGFFREALDVDPGYARAYVGLSQAFREHVGLPLTMRRDSALVYARKAVEVDPELAEAAAALGWAHLLSRRWSEAGEHFGRALQLDPNQADAMAGMARLSWAADRIGDAVRWQRRAVAVDPFSTRQVSWLGSYLFDVGDLAGALAAYRRAVELAPDAPAASYILAQIHLIRGEPEEAERTMRALLAVAGDHPGTRFLMGRFDVQMGRYETGQAHLIRSAEALGDFAALLVHRAHVARRLGDEARAQELLVAAEADLERWESEGFSGPRTRLHIQALRGDEEEALRSLREHWTLELGGDLLSGPQIGAYWIDADPLLADMLAGPPFQDRLREIRASLDSVRSRLPADGRTP